jgi:hypothetical protein
VRLILLAGLMNLLLCVSARSQDSNSITPDPYGLCSIGEIGGRAIVNSQGRLITLNEYCQQQVQAIEQQTPPPDFDQQEFWQAFLQIASPPAIAFSEMIDRQQLLAYSTTICPFLASGGAMQQIRAVQVQSQLLAAFAAAVNVAAVYTDCPQFSDQIGR